MTQAAEMTFANHRGVVPLLWVFVVLAGLELVGAHLLVGLWSHTLAWVLSGLTLLSLLWLIRWVTSWKRLPHELSADGLRLHMGSLRHLDVPLDAIEAITATIAPGALQMRDTRSLVPIAHPNRMILLRAPLAGRRLARRIAIWVDDPEAFDRAMSSALAR